MAVAEVIFDVQVYCLDVDFEKSIDRCASRGIRFVSLSWNSVCQ